MRRVAGSVAGAALCCLAQAQPARYSIDPTHTFVSFEVLHAGLSTVRVRFDRKQADVLFDAGNRRGSVDFTLQMDSVNSGVPALDALLKGSELFNVAEHPTARFVSKQLVFSGQQVSEASGVLTLRGVSQPVTFKVLNFNCYTSPLFQRQVCGGDLEAVIQRSRWGVGALPALAADSVRLLVQIEAIRQ